MLTPHGHAKVMDFGLAKRVGGPDSSQQEITATVTREGSTLGTLAYMSPEQLKGASVDSRSDIFSFGIVLYEMLTGVHPFRKSQSMETASAILTAEPDHLSKYNEEVPELLEHTVLKMLARDPKDRYPSIHEVTTTLGDPTTPCRQARLSPNRFWGLMALVIVVVGFLGWWILQEGTETPRVTSLAVLPLSNISGDPEQDYFVDGMTEALITDLSKIGALKVIARSSTMIYRGTSKPIDDIARELGVEALVQGSVFREGDRVGITAQLIEAATGQNLWADRYERALTSVLALQGEVAQAIAREIQVTLTPGEEALLTNTRAVNTEAYDALLMGMQKESPLTPQAFDIALEYYNIALEKDPNYATAYLAVAKNWLFRNQLGYTLPHEGGPKAKAAVLKALELDSTLAGGYSALAWVNFLYEWDWKCAEAAWKRAIKLNPNHSDSVYAQFLWVMKRPVEANAQMQRAMQLDPLNEVIQLHHAFLLESAGRDDEAIVEVRKLLRTSPQHPMLHGMLSTLLMHKDRHDEALAEMKASYSIIGDREVEEALTQGYAQSGYRGAMRSAADLLAGRARKAHVNSFDVALLYATAGENDLAFEWLEKSFEERSPHMPYVNAYVELKPLHSDPRFRDLLLKMNLPQLNVRSSTEE
jgi:TolB-like protein